METKETGAGQVEPLLQPGIEKVLLIPRQKNPARLAKALAAGLKAIDEANAGLPPKELEEHVTVIFVFPKPVP